MPPRSRGNVTTNPSGHALRRARPIPAAPRQPTALPSVCNRRSCLNETCPPAAIVQDRPTLSRPIARGLRQPRDKLTSSVIGHHRRCHVCRRPPARRLGRRRVAPLTALRMPCDRVSQRFAPRDDQPGRLVFGLRRIAAIDTSNPNHELHTRQHQMPILHKPSVDCGWIPTPPVRTEGTQLRATLVTGG